MIKLMLNLHKFNNYAFFCPVSRLHLTVSSPVGFANEVTPAILKGVKSKTLLDVDGVIDLETGTVKAQEEAQTTPEPAKTEETPVAPVAEAPTEVVEEPAKEEVAEQKEEGKQDKKASNKRGKRAEAAPVDEAK